MTRAAVALALAGIMAVGAASAPVTKASPPSGPARQRSTASP